MASIVSSPVQTADSAMRTFGKFIPSQPSVDEPTSSPTALRGQEPSDADTKPSQSSSSGGKRRADLSPKSSAAARANQFLKRERDRRDRVNDIVRLAPHEQIERLLEDFEHLQLRIDMQDKALNGLHQRGMQQDERDGQAKKELDDRLWRIEGSLRRQCAAHAEDLERAVQSMDSFQKDVDERVGELEKEGKEKAVMCRGDRSNVLNLKRKMDRMEDGIDEVKGRMGQVMRILDGQSKGAREFGHGGSEGGEAFAVEVPSSGKRTGACCPGDESPTKRARRVDVAGMF